MATAATQTHTTENPNTFCCESCAHLMRSGEAQVCRRALDGRTLCWRCRRREFPTFPVRHQVPAGFSAIGRWSGYGRPEVTLTRTRDGKTWIGDGMTDYDALRKARILAALEGAL